MRVWLCLKCHAVKQRKCCLLDVSECTLDPDRDIENNRNESGGVGISWWFPRIVASVPFVLWLKLSRGKKADIPRAEMTDPSRASMGFGIFLLEWLKLWTAKTGSSQGVGKGLLWCQEQKPWTMINSRSPHCSMPHGLLGWVFWYSK